MAPPKISLKRLPPFVRILILIVPLLTAFLLINFLILNPKARRQKAAKEEISRLHMEITRNKQQLAGFKPLSEAEIKEIAETEELFQHMVNSFTTAREVYDKITNKAVACGISDLFMDPSYRPRQAEEIIRKETELGLDQHRTYMKLNFHCELKYLGCFLEGLTRGEDYLIIESMTIKRELPKPGIELVLKLFTKS